MQGGRRRCGEVWNVSCIHTSFDRFAKHVAASSALIAGTEYFVRGGERQSCSVTMAPRNIFCLDANYLDGLRVWEGSGVNASSDLTEEYVAISTVRCNTVM